MGQEGIYVGIDVAKAKVDVAVRPTGERWEVPRDEAGIPQLVSEMKTLGPSLVLLEATGGLELPLVAALAGRGTAPLRQRPGRLPAPEESAPGSAQGHHRHGAQAGQAHLFHAAPRPRLRGCWRRILRANISTVRCVRPSGGRPNLATNWCQCPMLRACPSTHQRPSPEKPC